MSAKLLLIPVILLGIAVTYSQFGETLYIGSENDPNVVQTANLEWSLIKKKSSCFERAPAEPYASSFGEGDESQTIWIWFPRDSNPLQGETLRFNITFVFTQFNS